MGWVPALPRHLRLLKVWRQPLVLNQGKWWGKDKVKDKSKGVWWDQGRGRGMGWDVPCRLLSRLPRYLQRQQHLWCLQWAQDLSLVLALPVAPVLALVQAQAQAQAQARSLCLVLPRPRSETS